MPKAKLLEPKDIPQGTNFNYVTIGGIHRYSTDPHSDMLDPVEIPESAGTCHRCEDTSNEAWGTKDAIVMRCAPKTIDVWPSKKDVDILSRNFGCEVHGWDDLVCVLCGRPWIPSVKNRCQRGGMRSWGDKKGGDPSSWHRNEHGNYVPNPVPKEDPDRQGLGI